MSITPIRTAFVTVSTRKPIQSGRVVFVACVLALVTPAVAQESAVETVTEKRITPTEETIAGRTVDQYAEQLASENRVVRLRAVKSLGAFGEAAGPALKSALTHDDRAVAYTAAVHLGRIRGEPLKLSVEELTQLAENKESLALRLAGAFALCRAGQIEKRLSVLIDALSYPDRGTACSAAELIGMLGNEAEAAIEPLEKVFAKNDPAKRNGDYHIGGAAKNAIRKIRGE
jgi:hypothetical protein